MTIASYKGLLLCLALGCLALSQPVEAAVPSVNTLPVTGLTNNIATLQGTVNPNGAPTLAWFEWDSPAAAIYRQRTDPQPVGSGMSSVPLAATLTNLTSGLPYHCRVVASNSFGVARAFPMPFRSMGLTLRGANPLLVSACAPFSDPGAAPTTPPSVMAAGSEHCLALKPDGTVEGWGRNLYGVANSLTLPQAIALSAGSEHNLALLADGSISAWGDSSYGKTSVPFSAYPAVAVAAGGDFSLALRSDGRVVAWGDNTWGQTSVPASAQASVVAISAGAWHSLALKADGTVVAWGAGRTVGAYHEYGQSIVPPNATNVVAVAAGAQNSMVLRADGSVLVWGQSCCGITNVPAEATNIVGIALSCNSTYCLALRADGKLLGWGDGCCGQTATPPDATNVVAIAPGGFHTVVLRADGTLLGWGDTGFGELPVPADVTSNNLPVTTSGTVDPATPGTYSLTYSVTNVTGGTATATRTVVVNQPTPAFPLRLTPLVANGAFHLAFTNTPCASFKVVGTGDLRQPANTWSVLGPVTEVSPGQFDFADPDSSGQGTRFYRVIPAGN